jgi:hypothetical protein
VPFVHKSHVINKNGDLFCSGFGFGKQSKLLASSTIYKFRSHRKLALTEGAFLPFAVIAMPH